LSLFLIQIVAQYLGDLRLINPDVSAKGMQLWGWPWRVPDNVMV